MPKPAGCVETLELALDQIVAEDWFEDKRLTAAMAQVGQLHPIIVWKTGEEKYALAAGRGRLASARALGLETLTADVYEGELAAMAAVALAEGVRRDNPVAQAVQVRMLRTAGQDPDQIRAVSGLSSSQQEERLDYLRLPANMRADLLAGRMRPSAAKALLKLPDEESQQRALELAWETNRARKHPLDHPAVKDIRATVRRVRGELQQQMPVPIPIDAEPEGADPVAVAAAVRRMRDEREPEGPLDDAYLAVIIDLEGGAR